MTGSRKLTATQVKSLGPGKYSDGQGLWLIKRLDGGGQWVLRVTVHGKRREMGLGGILDVSLKDARDLAEEWRKLGKQGVDPIRERDKRNREAVRNLHLLEDVALDAFEARKAELRDDGRAGRWMSPLTLHVLPKIGKIPVAEVNQIDIRDALAPIWQTKADTARKAMNRLNICLKHGAALGLDVDIQAVEKAKALLGRQSHQSKNISSLPWAETPDFYRKLTKGGVASHALRMLILTGSRSKPIRFMNLDQVDGDVWTIPGEMMKGRKNSTKAFRIPLSLQALEIIEAMEPFSRDGFLFPGAQRGVISDAAMAKVMRSNGLEARPHGFRSSLRTWLSETQDTSFEVSEKILSHEVGSRIVRAYQRSDLLDQRRDIMEQWANYVCGQK